MCNNNLCVCVCVLSNIYYFTHTAGWERFVMVHIILIALSF